MSGYVANLIDHGSLFLCLGYLIFYYRKSAGKKPTKPWLVPLLSCLVIYHGICLLMTLSEGPPPDAAKLMAQTPDRKELTKLMEKAKVAIFDSKVTLKRGPRITVPAGYRYIEPAAGALLCYCEGPNKEVVSVTFLGEVTDLAEAAQSMRKVAKEKKRTWELGPSRKESFNGCDALVMKFTDPITDVDGYEILESNGKYCYMLFVDSPVAYRSINEPDFQRLIKSFEAGY